MTRTFVNRSLIVQTRVLLALGLLASAISLGTSSVHAATDPRVAAFTKLDFANRNGSGDLPRGCATLAGDHVCLPPVKFDGQRIPDLTVLNGDVAYAARNVGIKLADQRAVHVGIATGVFNQLVVAEGKRDGVVVTMAEARLVAKNALLTYKKNSSTARLPKGVSAKTYFTSARAVAGIRRSLIYTAELKKIESEYKKLSVNDAVKAYQTWYRARLPRHTVTIGGKKPAFDLPNALQ
jgi:hypothetical protein